MNEKLIKLITIQLRNELPKGLEGKVVEFELLIDEKNFRAAFSVLEELKHIKGWSPSLKLLSYYEEFWWKIAN